VGSLSCAEDPGDVGTLLVKRSLSFSDTLIQTNYLMLFQKLVMTLLQCSNMTLWSLT